MAKKSFSSELYRVRGVEFASQKNPMSPLALPHLLSPLSARPCRSVFLHSGWLMVDDYVHNTLLLHMATV